MKEFNELISMLSINCHKCLDNHMLWKYGDYRDETKRFIILKCDKCCNGQFIDYYRKNNIIMNNKPIFNIYDILLKDDHYIYTSSRIPTLRKLWKLKISEYMLNELL